MRKLFTVGSICMLLTWFCASAFAGKPRFGDTLTFSAGGMLHRGSGSIASTRPDVPVDELRFKDLGLDDQTRVFWADVTWQFAERWQFSLNYSSYDAEGVRMTTRSGNFGDLEWVAGARLTSDFNLDLYIADLTWDFIKTDRAHAGLGFGVHAADMDLDMLVEIGGGIGGIGGSIEARREQASLLAPLPNLSLMGGIMLADKVYLNAHLGYLSLSYDKYDGSLFSARGNLEWRPWKRVGLGVAYQYVDLDVKVKEDDLRERYDFRFYGPILFLSYGF